jgi:TolA-binding protein
MNCEQTRENLAAYIDGELDEEMVAGIQAHLEGCEGCRDELEMLRQTARALEGFLEPRAMKESVAESVLATLASQKGRRRVPLRTRLAWALTGAAAAVFVLAIFGFFGSQQLQPQPVFADEIVDEALADHTKTMELFKKQVVNSAVRDPETEIRFIRIELELSGLKEKTARLEKLLSCSRHPKRSEIRRYISSVRDLLHFVKKPPLNTPEVISPALREKALKISPVQGVIMVSIGGHADGLEVDIPGGLDDVAKEFMQAKADLYKGDLAGAARAFSVVVKQAPESSFAKDAEYWKSFINIQADDNSISIKGDITVPRHPAWKAEMGKDFMEFISRKHGDHNFDPGRWEEVIEKIGKRMGITIERSEDEQGNTVIKVERKDRRGNVAKSVVKFKAAVKQQDEKKDTEEDRKKK